VTAEADQARMALAGDEQRIVQHYLRPLTGGVPEALDLIDDCALVRPEPGCELVFKTDAVVAGVHFFADDGPTDIAFKALAVNVSDLIAKAALPRFWQMTLAFPEPPRAIWLEQLCAGFADVQAQSGIRLIGGDLVKTTGPLVISITAVGTVRDGQMLRRGGGQPGDQVYVSGTIGDAALGLKLRAKDARAVAWPLDPGGRDHLVQRFLRPNLAMGLIAPLQQHARAGMDISDGLAIDFSRLCRAAGLGGTLFSADVPLSRPAALLLAADPTHLTTILTGGDDYEVLAAVAPDQSEAFEHEAQRAGITVKRIGELVAGSAIQVLDHHGQALQLGSGGYLHF
jgi:thiamine-monophosphate kinase